MNDRWPAAGECQHGLEAAWCSLCKAPAPAAPEPPGPAIVAQHDGHCPSCNLPVRAGEMIRKDFDRWVHDGCERQTKRRSKA